MPGAARTIHDFVCVACGCMCDDLSVEIAGNRVVGVAPPCPVAAKFLLAEPPTPLAECLIDGEPASLDTALERAAEILRSAAAPLVMGLEGSTVDAQRAAVAIADRLGAVIDPTDEFGRSRNHTAIATVGAVTATLGEVAARSDLIVYWCVDPQTTHPRHIERFARGKTATAEAESARPPRVVVVDVERTTTAQAADEFLAISTDSGAECLTTLRALVRGVALDEATVLQQTGLPLAKWKSLADQLKAAKYAAIFHEPPRKIVGGPDPQSQAMAELVQDLHRHTRAVALRMGSPGNAVGAAQVLAWQTGFPAAVSFARGYPQYLPGEATAERLLERGAVDAALIIAADPLAHLSSAAQAHLRSILCVVVDERVTKLSQAATVAIFTAKFGVQTAGSVYRSDGVALPLRAATCSTLPGADEVLTKLAARL